MAPFVIFLAILIFVRPLNGFVFESLTVNNLLRTVLVSITGFIVAYLAARSFLLTGLVPLVWLGSGMLILATTILAGTWLPAGTGRTMIAATGTLLASLAQLPATFFWRRYVASKTKSAGSTYMYAVYGSAVLLLALIFLLSSSGVIPPIPRTGLATFRFLVSLSAGILYALVGLYLLWRYFESRSSFLYWYSLGLLFLASMQVMISISNLTGEGSVGTWIARGFLYLSGVYPLIAVTTVIREARAKRVPVVEVVAAFFRQTRESYQRAADSASAAVGVSRSGMTVGKWLGVAIPLLLLLSLLLPRAADISFVYYPVLSFLGLNVTLFSVLSIIFVALISLVVALLAGRSFAATGRVQLAWLGGGALLFGFSGLLAAVAQNQINVSATIHNIGSLLAAASYVISALYSWNGRSLLSHLKTRTPVLIGIYGGDALLMLLITLFSLSGLTPTFFIPGTGSTLVRVVVLGSAYMLFAVSGILLMFLYFRSRVTFLYWYAMGLILITLGLFTVSFVKIPGDFFAWLGRAGQYIGGIYLAIAVATVVKEARTRHVSLDEVIAEFGRQAGLNYELLVNTASDAIIAVDDLGRILNFNPAAEKMFDYRRGEAIGTAFFNLISSPEEVDGYKQAADKAIPEKQEQGSLTIETRARRKNWEEFPVELTMVSRSLVAGWPPTTTLVIRDITERKKAEDALRYGRERFQILSEANALLLTSGEPEAIVQTIATKVMTHLNCDVFFNYILEEAKGRLRLNAYAGIPSEVARDIEWLDIGVAICGCVARDGRRIVSENVQENGDERAALVRSFGIQAYACHPLHIGGKTIGTLSFGTRSRISFTNDELELMRTVVDQMSVAMQRNKAEEALRESEERFFKAFHASPVGQTIARLPDGRWVEANDSFLRLMEYTREEVTGHTSAELGMFPDPNERARILRVFLERGKVQNQELTVRTKTGKLLTVLSSNEKISLHGQEYAMSTIAQCCRRNPTVHVCSWTCRISH